MNHLFIDRSKFCKVRNLYKGEGGHSFSFFFLLKSKLKKEIFEVGKTMCVNYERRVNSCFFFKVVLTRPEITIRDRELSVICFMLVCFLRMIGEE